MSEKDAGRVIGRFEDGCLDIRLSTDDVERFMLDNPEILLELRPGRDEYGIFYTAKGRQWDVWADPEEPDEQKRGTAYAMREPIQAACELLAADCRPDFRYDPSEDD